MKIYHKIKNCNSTGNLKEVFEIHNEGEIITYSFEELCAIFEYEELTPENFKIITEGVEAVDECIAIWEQINE